jgi:hypothetical protein
MARASTTFKKGQSGNPKGRPAGKTARTKFRDAVENALPGIIQGIILAAQAGDPAAVKMILDRTIPALKPTSDAMKLPSAGSLVDRGEAIIKAMATGSCTPDQARLAIAVLGEQSKLLEQSEILQRLETIESWLHEQRKDGR